MNEYFQKITLEATKAKAITHSKLIQNLWSGYGQIVRLTLKDYDKNTVVAKHVRLPKQDKHPRGWNTDLSHERKVKSYEVEIAFYKKFSAQCNDACRIPLCLANASQGDEVLIVLEDLDSSGFPLRKNSVSWSEMQACISWLANFHACFLGIEPTNLWEVGTYWHLDTRPEELEILTDLQLKNAASAIDRVLNNCTFKTFVHGDAKLANFCFSKDGKQVAAVDFQYVGGGCGMKDLAYFVGSCFYENDCERMEEQILSFYFESLKLALQSNNSKVDFKALEQEWRSLYPVAWTDFHRFLKGWSPGHWKLNSYSERIAKETINKLGK